MTAKEIKSLALKLGAIYLLIQFFLLSSITTLGFAHALTEWMGGGLTPIIATLLGMFAIILPLALAYILWRLSNSLTATPLELENKGDFAHFHEFQAAILCGVGLLILGFAVPDFVTSCYLLIRETGIQDSGIRGKASMAMLIPFSLGLAQIIFALSLIWGREGWSRLLFRIRYGGT